MAIDMLYFAWVREAIGLAEERVEPPDSVDTVSALIDWLAERGGGYATAFADRDRLRMAVNQEFAAPDAALPAHCEVAVFPPVTGG